MYNVIYFISEYKYAPEVAILGEVFVMKIVDRFIDARVANKNKF
jgi:hypothetical protein